MSLKNEFVRMVTQMRSDFAVPAIADVFFPPFYKGGQPGDAQFMAIVLEGGSAGISYVLLPDEKNDEYNVISRRTFAGKDPLEYALQFGSDDPVSEMVSMASINAICQYVMKETDFPVDHATDSLGLLSVEKGDRVGMVGLFSGLPNVIKKAGAELIIIERRENLVQKYGDLPVTLDITKLAECNKVLCTGTTVLNNSLDEILNNCLPDAFVSVIGPTAGYFPDPLFTIGVDVVGGRIVADSEEFLTRLKKGKKWGETTLKTCFQKKTYKSMLKLI